MCLIVIIRQKKWALEKVDFRAEGLYFLFCTICLVVLYNLKNGDLKNIFSVFSNIASNPSSGSKGNHSETFCIFLFGSVDILLVNILTKKHEISL